MGSSGNCLHRSKLAPGVRHQQAGHEPARPQRADRKAWGEGPAPALPPRRGKLLRHREYNLARLIRYDRRIRDQKCSYVATEQAQMAKCAGQKKQILVVKNSAASNSSRAGVKLVVDKVHYAWMFPFGLVSKADRDGILNVTRRWPLPLR